MDNARKEFICNMLKVLRNLDVGRFYGGETGITAGYTGGGATC